MLNFEINRFDDYNEVIENILDEGADDKNDISFHAQVIKKKLGDNKEFLEFILAVLYKLGHSDHVYSEEEDLEIRKVAHEFGIKESLLSRTLRKFSLNTFKVNNA